ncbi:hypothetical protein AeMF1_008381 [Aphanomyces euteiches]|nr:hypothetical protein AeMF1_008381 [Aphanomyces euteiches]
MEAPTKFFFRKPRDTVTAKTISEVKDTEGTMQTKQSEIEKTFVEHWTRIMNTETTTATNQHETQTKMWSNIESKLSDDEAKWLDDELTPADFTASIKCQSNNKSPGPDGFAAEFFKIHPVNFGKIFHTLFQYQFERQALLKPQQTSLITLLPKAGDPTYAYPKQETQHTQGITDRLHYSHSKSKFSPKSSQIASNIWFQNLFTINKKGSFQIDPCITI